MPTCNTCHRRFPTSDNYCPFDGTALRTTSRILADDFELHELIGEGGTGAVYRAWQRSMSRWVAVKLLHGRFLADSGMQARFQREVHSIARLSHPNIVMPLQVGKTPQGAPFLAMEYVAGTSLESLLASGALSQDRAMAIALQVCSALGDTHAAGIIHRDLKPGNIMLADHQCQRDTVKVLDFGLAKARDGFSPLGAEDDFRLTTRGAVFGTPHYLSPEQAQGEDIDHRADIYSLGVVLFHMLAGRVPFEGNALSLLLAHASLPAPRVTDWAPEVAPEVADLVARCLSKRPSDRFESAEALAAQLRGLLHTPSGETSIVGMTATVHHPQRRRGRTLVLTAVMGLAVVFGIGHSAGGRSQPAAIASSLPAPTSLTVPAPMASAPQRTVMVAHKGYSMRLLLPSRLRASQGEAQLTLDAWDAEGLPMIVDILEVELQHPDGRSVPVTAAFTGTAGRYALRAAHAMAGAHALQVRAPAGDAVITVYYDVE